jgi:hypothetical protein
MLTSSSAQHFGRACDKIATGNQCVRTAEL